MRHDRIKYFKIEAPDPDFSECFACPEGQKLVMDLFVPEKGRHNGAAVILIHGGGWNGGERHGFWWHAHRLSLHGYVAGTVDYRLSSIAPFPAAVNDCQAAVRWLRHNADRFNIQRDRIGAIGSSAGGHLAACLGVFEEMENTISARVNCVVDVHGVHDFISAVGNSNEVKEHWEAFIGGPFSEKRDLWLAASPALHVDSSSAPMLLVHDPKDETVPYEQSLILANALIKAGRPMQFLPSPGSAHGFVYNPQNSWTQQVWPVALAWLDHYLLKKTSGELSKEVPADSFIPEVNLP